MKEIMIIYIGHEKFSVIEDYSPFVYDTNPEHNPSTYEHIILIYLPALFII